MKENNIRSERDVEKALKERVKCLGGTCEKFTSPGRRSVPDRIITLPKGKIIFVEVKKKGKKITRAQKNDHDRRLDLGCDVRVVEGIEMANAFKE